MTTLTHIEFFFAPPDGVFLSVKPKAGPLAVSRWTLVPNRQRDDYDRNLYSLRVNAYFVANGLNLVDHRNWLPEPLRYLGSCLAFCNDLFEFRRANVFLACLECRVAKRPKCADTCRK